MCVKLVLPSRDCSLPSPVSQVVKPSLDKLASDPAPKNVSLEQLYKDGAHQRNDMMEECLWKGEPCEPDYFRDRFTDLGLCQTFDPPSKVEKSGEC